MPQRTPVVPMRLQVWLLVAVVLLFVVAPACALGQPRPAVLGWQMYSAQPEVPQIREVLASGDYRLSTPDLVAPKWRAEIDYGAVLPEYLCDRDTAVRSVELVYRGTGTATEHVTRHTCTRD